MTDPSVSLRRVAACLGALPMGYWPEKDHPASWSTTDHLLATLIDCVRELTWVTASANSKRKIEHPKPVYRPKAESRAPAARPRASWTDFIRQLARVEDGHG